jgi:hypothetical protein
MVALPAALVLAEDGGPFGPGRRGSRGHLAVRRERRREPGATGAATGGDPERAAAPDGSEPTPVGSQGNGAGRPAGRA